VCTTSSCRSSLTSGARLDRAAPAGGVRVEARGLDEQFNLVVDRSPRMNYRARSTPEFILRRLQSKATGEERKVYDVNLKRFGEDAAERGRGGFPAGEGRTFLGGRPRDGPP